MVGPRDVGTEKTKRSDKKRALLLRLMPMLVSLALIMIILFMFTGRQQTWTSEGDGLVDLISRPYIPISPEEAKKMLASEENVVLLDVRTRQEHDDQHIPGSTLIPLDQLGNLITDEIPDRDTAIILYCRSGRRSKEAAAILARLGYTRIYDLGGIIDWPFEVAKSY
ncbi:MAG TPA: rhodanese-like domain-containing protein [Atribacteraceae bacterium]|nr:rhodanese-like domain-containing protein [Atribacteraceae bacterium]